jgi:hypothetical protein
VTIEVGVEFPSGMVEGLSRLRGQVPLCELGCEAMPEACPGSRGCAVVEGTKKGEGDGETGQCSFRMLCRHHSRPPTNEFSTLAVTERQIVIHGAHRSNLDDRRDWH